MKLLTVALPLNGKATGKTIFNPAGFSIMSLAVSSLLWTAGVDAGKVYKCIDGDGNVVYSQVQCPDSPEEVKIWNKPAKENHDTQSLSAPSHIGDQTERVTREKNKLNRELWSILRHGGDRARVRDIKERLWELDEEYWQRWFKNNKQLKEKYYSRFKNNGDPSFQSKAQQKEGYLCIKYRFRKSELQRGIDSAFIKNDSRAGRLFQEYDIGIRSNCKSD